MTWSGHIAILSLAALLIPPVDGQDTLRAKLDRFALFNECRPMVLVITVDDTADIELTKKAMQAAAESRLRAARLYTKNSIDADSALLYVTVNVLSVRNALGERVFRNQAAAFILEIKYRKEVTDRFGEGSRAATWETGTLGIGDASYILSTLSRHMDEFLAEYLRVNADACGTPASP